MVKLSRIEKMNLVSNARFISLMVTKNQMMKSLFALFTEFFGHLVIWFLVILDEMKWANDYKFGQIVYVDALDFS